MSAACDEQQCQELFGLFPDPRVHLLTAPVQVSALATLSASESAALAGMAQKRRREFATARALARAGLERFFNVRGYDLLNADDRSPIWPPGIAGSISHSNTRAWVALVDAAYGTIGIDGEDRECLKPELWHLTLRDEEQAYLATLDPSRRGRHALALFCAKEALYKAQYPRTQTYMGYQALQVELTNDGSLRCTFREAVGAFPIGYTADGRWSDAGALVASVWLPRR